MTDRADGLSHYEGANAGARLWRSRADEDLRSQTSYLRDAARCGPVVAFLRAGDMSICLLLKSAGFKPSPNTTDARHLDGIGSVHLDIHVDDLKAACKGA